MFTPEIKKERIDSFRDKLKADKNKRIQELAGKLTDLQLKAVLYYSDKKNFNVERVKW